MSVNIQVCITNIIHCPIHHHATLLPALPGRSPSTSNNVNEGVILNKQGAPPSFPKSPPFSRRIEATSSSQQQKLDPSVFFDTFSNVCQQQLAQQHNQQLYGLIERLLEKLNLVSGQSISARDLLEAKLRGPRLIEDDNATAQCGQAQGSLSNGNNGAFWHRPRGPGSVEPRLLAGDAS